MGEEPQFPPIPSISEVYYRKDRIFERKFTVIKCESCQAKYERPFKPGDYTFKKVTDEQCEKCQRTKLNITEIYSEFVDPKKDKKHVKSVKEPKKDKKKKKK